MLLCQVNIQRSKCYYAKSTFKEVSCYNLLRVVANALAPSILI